MPPKVVVVISANTEWKIVKEHFPHTAYQPSPYGEWFEINLPQHSTPSTPAQRGLSKGVEGQLNQPITHSQVAFFHQGWGKIAAAGATQYAIDRWQPDVLINLGTCGGFAGEIERFAIILAEKTLVYDIVEQMSDFDEAIAHYATELDLSWLSEEQKYPQKVTRTLLVSADRDLIAGEIPQLKAKYGAVAGDWESGAIAWVAVRNNVRCLILRGVTDLVSEQGGGAYDGNLEVFKAGTRKVMGELLENLPGWISLALTP